jgi:hypothetical protein
MPVRAFAKRLFADDSLTDLRSNGTLAEGLGSVIRQCPYPRAIPPSTPHKPAGTTFAGKYRTAQQENDPE